MAKDVIEEELFEEEVEESVKDIDSRPSMMDDEWSDYVMSHFKSNELIVLWAIPVIDTPRRASFSVVDFHFSLR